MFSYWRTRRSNSSISCTFLSVQLSTRTSYLSSCFCVSIRNTSICLLQNIEFMNQSIVNICVSKNIFVQLLRLYGFSFCVMYCNTITHFYMITNNINYPTYTDRYPLYVPGTDPFTAIYGTH